MRPCCLWWIWVVSMRIALGLEYNGSGFEGWHTQPHKRTVQDTLEYALHRIADETVSTVCAGRTDTGVHASLQVAHFDTNARRPISAWVRGVNRFLPAGVAILWAREMPPSFNARYSALARSYRYVLLNRPVRPGLDADKVGWFHLPLNENLMQQGANVLLGTHDFSSFRAAQCQAKSPVKILQKATVWREGEYIYFECRANSFLHHMVRNIVGALVFIGAGKRPWEWMGELLAARERSLAAPTFSPAGLYLSGVDYGDLLEDLGS